MHYYSIDRIKKLSYFYVFYGKIQLINHPIIKQVSYEKSPITSKSHSYKKFIK